MVLVRKTRGFANNGRVHDARDVIRNRNNSHNSRGGAGARSGGVQKRIIRTSQGLVTNKKTKGISTSQFKHRQRDQNSRPSGIAPSRKPTNDRARPIGVNAAMRRSTIINSNPVLQKIVYLLMPITVGSGAVNDEDTLSSKNEPLDLNVNLPEAPVAQSSNKLDGILTKNDNRSDETSPSSSSVELERPDSEVDDFELPGTCKVLKAPNGNSVYLIGSAHFSVESQSDVRRVIRAVRPNSVMVELCKQRIHVLTQDEKFLLEEASNLTFDKIRITLRRMGVLQGAMYILLLKMSAQITNTLKVAPGGEFRTAYQESQRLPRCQIILGDRELSVTLRRAWASLGVFQRMRIIWHLLSSGEEVTIEDVERCKEKDILDKVLAELCVSFPDLSRVLINERDWFLCRSLFDIATNTPSPATIVAVVGIGHQQGIIDHWGTADSINLHSLEDIPEPGLDVRITAKVLRIGMYIGVGVIVYKLTPTSVKQLLSESITAGLRNGAGKINLLLRSY